MLETGPQFEGSFQLHWTADRGGPVVCKESTAHHHHDGTAKRSTAHSTVQRSAAQRGPQRLLSFFFLT